MILSVINNLLLNYRFVVVFPLKMMSLYYFFINNIEVLVAVCLVKDLVMMWKMKAKKIYAISFKVDILIFKLSLLVCLSIICISGQYSSFFDEYSMTMLIM